MWLLLIPILVLIVMSFMLASVLAGAVWLVGAGWPWLLIVLGAWMFWHEDGRYNRRRVQRASQGSAVGKQQPRPAPVDVKQFEPKRPRAQRKPELPIDVQVKIEQIRRKVDVLLGFADRFPPFSRDLYLVRQTASDYLPRTIDAFTALPSERTDQPLSAEGKTARQELKVQLDLLDAKLDDIAQDLQRQDADRLLANRRFLEARFGLSDQLSQRGA
jgi:hypothetical protein